MLELLSLFAIAYILTFAGSPLNRLSFLRTEHPFLSAAIRHPSTRFILFKDLAPLTRSTSELYLAHYDEIKTLVRPDIYDKTEEDMLKEYDSRKTEPQLIFLGLDEERKKDGLNWKIYTGTPYFALDLSARGSEEQQGHAKSIVEALEAKGAKFLHARVVTTLSADEGAVYISHNTRWIMHLWAKLITNIIRLLQQLPSLPRLAPFWIGTYATRSVVPAARLHCPSMPAPSVHARPLTPHV